MNLPRAWPPILAVLLARVASLLGLSPVSAARVNAEPVPAASFNTATFNVRKDMAPARVRADIMHARAYAGLISWNEIQRPAGRRAVLDLGPGWRTYAPRLHGHMLPNPISWRTRDWALIDGGFERVAVGYGSIGPSRYAEWVLLRNRATGQRVARLSTHLGAHGFCAHRQPVLIRFLRQSSWYRARARVIARVDRLHGLGYSVIASGDFNRSRFHVLGGAVAYDNGLRDATFRGAHYDYLMHALPDPRLRALGHFTVRLHSDHALVVQHYSLRNPNG
jgi:hypothetical protein